MADISEALAGAAGAEVQAGRRRHSEEPLWDVIELLFFAYREFVGEADKVLAELGFGRAHHRVLHFINRHPDMKVAELLDLLQITKQSLGRVLRDLVERGYVAQRAGESDRRHRLLQTTPKGEALAMRLARLQTRRIHAALDAAGPGAHKLAVRFLAGMIDAEQRSAALDVIARGNAARGNR